MKLIYLILSLCLFGCASHKPQIAQKLKIGRERSMVNVSDTQFSQYPFQTFQVPGTSIIGAQELNGSWTVDTRGYNVFFVSPKDGSLIGWMMNTDYAYSPLLVEPDVPAFLIQHQYHQPVE